MENTPVHKAPSLKSIFSKSCETCGLSCAACFTLLFLLFSAKKAASIANRSPSPAPTSLDGPATRKRAKRAIRKSQISGPLGLINSPAPVSARECDDGLDRVGTPLKWSLHLPHTETGHAPPQRQSTVGATSLNTDDHFHMTSTVYVVCVCACACGQCVLNLFLFQYSIHHVLYLKVTS